MNNKYYNNWKASKRDIDINEDFSKEVMQKIYQHELKPNEKHNGYYGFILSIYNTPYTKAGMIITAATLGFTRILLMIYLVFEL